MRRAMEHMEDGPDLDQSADLLCGSGWQDGNITPLVEVPAQLAQEATPTYAPYTPGLTPCRATPLCGNGVLAQSSSLSCVEYDNRSSKNES